VPCIEAKGTQSYRSPDLPFLSTHFHGLCSHKCLSVLVATLLLACAPDELPAGDPRVDAAIASQHEAAPDVAAVTASPGMSNARGLWVLAEGSVRVLDDPARAGALLDRAQKLGATDLFVQVYRGGRAFYPAGPGIERTPIAENQAATGIDSLQLLLEDAHGRGMKVHAWVNVLSLSTRRDARMIAELGRSAILVDRLGRSVLDYPDLDIPEPDRQFYRMGTRGIYLDPAVSSVRERLVATFHDLLVRYPELDGLHLDYIRHPGVLPFSPGSRFGVGLEFGYGAESRARYRAETGRPDPIDGAQPGTVRSASAWDAWRRHQVTTLVEEIAAASRAVRPGVVLSAAVIPYVDRAYLSLAQDWRHWLESGAIDLAIPMVYTLDDRLLRYQLETFAGWAQRDQIWPGLGVWLFDDAPDRAARQLEALRALPFRGEVLFSDDALSTAPSLLEMLAETAPAR
jgi:uncharacterized lipoprotein YddW (UPF0748 family)